MPNDFEVDGTFAHNCLGSQTLTTVLPEVDCFDFYEQFGTVQAPELHAAKKLYVAESWWKV